MQTATPPARTYRRLRHFLRATLIALAALALAGCGAVSVEQQVPLASPSFQTLAAGDELGQTFVVHHDGLAGVELYLRPGAPGDGVLQATLRAAPGSEPLAGASLPVVAVTQPGMYALAFAEPLPSRQRDYYLSLIVAGPGSVEAAVMPPDTYRDGSLYRAGRPAEGQLVHGHRFAAGPRLLGFVARLAELAGVLLAALLVLVLPGLGLLAALDLPGARRSPAERVALATGVSVALLALLLVWADRLGLALGPWNAWLPALLGAGLLGGRAIAAQSRRGGGGELPGARSPRRRGDSATLAPQLVLLAVMLVALLVRLVAVGSLEAPLWGDAYQHAMITQLILDNGGLFSSWAPYEPYETLTVQFGFSAAAAALAWATGMGAVEATIVVGQLLNAAAALALYPLATRVAGGRAWAGVVAVLVAGLLTPLPGFYVNWGRYAQLAGQVVLPAAMLLTWDLLAAGGGPAARPAWRHVPAAALLGLVVAGMVLSYYRLAFFYAAFIGALLLCWALPTWGRDWRAWRGGLAWLAVAGVFTAALFAPWALHVRSSNLAETIQIATGMQIPLAYVQADYAAWGLLPRYMPPWMLAVAAVGVAWGAARRDWMVPGMALWLVPPAGYMATSLLGVPGAVMLQSFAVVISTYIPVAVAWGYLAVELGRAAGDTGEGRRRLAARGALAAALGALALWGGLQQLRVIDPSHILVTRPDTRAMAWVRAEAPPDARFLVHGFDVYDGTTAVGADAGWWLALLGRRANTMPPQYALANERPEPPDYSRRVVELVHTLKADPPTTQDGMAALCAEGITHLYHGQGQGRVGTAGPTLFTTAELEASPQFTLRYAEDRVRIYEFDRAVCR